MYKNKLKRLLKTTAAIALAAILTLSASAAPSGLGNFAYSETFSDGQFSDVRPGDWFTPYVRDAVNYGFFRGRSEIAFEPLGPLTLGETVALASRLRSIYHTGAADFEQSAPFYAVYAEYALRHGIIDAHLSYGTEASRFEFASIIYRALPYSAFAQINDIPDFGISDVASDTPAGAAVYTLYRAGILTGSDRFGTFFGSSNITRAEAAAIMVRLASPSSRLGMSLPSRIPTQELFIRNTDAVFMIETFDERDISIRTGSGFFINNSGLAVTALHVFGAAKSATITTFDGEVFDIAGIRAVNEEFNLAIIEIDSDKTDWSYLILADSDAITVGSTVFAIGSPRELINSITEGIVAHTGRELDTETMIQFTAPISFGSGGGPVLNTLGQVIGVASSSFTYGQNLNLAIPVNLIKELTLGPLVSFEEYQHSLIYDW